jgi:hypothetical protein
MLRVNTAIRDGEVSSPSLAVRFPAVKRQGLPDRWSKNLSSL